MKPAMNSSERFIRSLVESDIGALQHIDDTAHGAPWSYRTYADEIDAGDRLHLVAEADDQVLGHAAAWFDDGSCRITNVAVAAVCAGRGHATALLVALINESLSAYRVRNIQLEVRPTNRRAQRLYSRFGFVPVGVDRDFYDRSDEQGSRDAVVMVVADVCSDAWRERFAEICDETAQQKVTTA